MPESNVARVRAIFANRDIPGFVADLHPEVVWDGTRVMPDATVARGHRALEATFRRFFRSWEPDFQSRVEEAVDLDGERVLAIILDHGTSKGTGITIDRKTIQIWEFREGRPIRVTVYPTRAEAMAELS